MCQQVNDVIHARKRKFLTKYSVSENSLCQVFARVVICDNYTRYVLPFVLYCYLVKFFLFSFCFCTIKAAQTTQMSQDSNIIYVYFLQEIPRTPHLWRPICPKKFIGPPLEGSVVSLITSADANMSRVSSSRRIFVWYPAVNSHSRREAAVKYLVSLPDSTNPRTVDWRGRRVVWRRARCYAFPRPKW